MFCVSPNVPQISKSIYEEKRNRDVSTYRNIKAGRLSAQSWGPEWGTTKLKSDFTQKLVEHHKWSQKEQLYGVTMDITIKINKAALIMHTFGENMSFF